MKYPRLAAVLTAATMVATMAACGNAEKTSEKESAGGGDTAGALIGITMPTRSSERWIHDGDNLKSQLEGLGYKVDLQYAENDIPTQTQQLDSQITKGAKVLIIASIDGEAITTQLENAKTAGIKVIAYDRLIRKSPNVDYYATFDNFKVGVQQATSLLTGLGVLDATGNKVADKKGPFNVELFAGSPDDNNATFFFNGAKSILDPYIADGTLVVKSGQKDFETVATLRWDPETAQKRMENILTSTYKDGSKVQGVLSPYDGISIGILSALKSGGYGTGSQAYPIVTGQDAELASVKSIMKGEQYSTIFKDTRNLAKATGEMADAILKGQTPKTNNTTDYNNGVKVVPSQLLESLIVTKDNYEKELVATGYFTADQLK
ncbi:sugar ABC transporter substrate-binding protein [Actinoplanes philippinensis]|uniref:Putative multiple sugar transport system substrate-binding protein n=1 Tax=Actinoplanes philippinensis TaxID=35752 RepID=A0A1I2CXR5_9ACTN|nr:multiple monosaccharide ABC transporter substrate-binding protein [Actinoplanes philippinensis]GIE74610.1 sugar ABC transporter substrate-binding protein [Actinoplanes philippinensis]SFE73081.1 putative multiple sugar transport system substrate-binding protein [Actinoplanes philippinensis]